MRINLYDTRINETFETVLLKEKGFNYADNILDTPNKLVNMMNQLFYLKELGEEHCYILSLNSKCRILGVFLLSKGSINQSFVGSREIYIRALLCGASGIILIHNHPSLSLDELRKVYKKLVVKHHPDNAGSDEVIKEINAEYETLFQRLKDSFEHSETYNKTSDKYKQNYDWQKDTQIRNMILKLSYFTNIEVEICGVWIWVSNCYEYRKELK